MMGELSDDSLTLGPASAKANFVAPLTPSHQGGTICGLSPLASFLNILSLKRVCCVFRDIRDKNAVNEGFWTKTSCF